MSVGGFTIAFAGGPPGALNPRINLEMGGPSRLPLAGWGFSVSGPAGPTYLSPAIQAGSPASAVVALAGVVVAGKANNENPFLSAEGLRAGRRPERTQRTRFAPSAQSAVAFCLITSPCPPSLRGESSLLPVSGISGYFSFPTLTFSPDFPSQLRYP